MCRLLRGGCQNLKIDAGEAEVLENIYVLSLEDLQIHPFNQKIYKDYQDATFDEDIKKHGIRSPIVINENKQILDGARRYKRAVKFGLKTIPAVVRSYDDEELAIIMFNKYREKTPRELYMESRALEDRFKPLFKVGRPSKEGEHEDKLSRNPRQFSRLEEKVASELGFSSFKLRQIQQVYDNEERIPEIASALEAGRISVNRAAEAARLVLNEGVPEEIVISKALADIPIVRHTTSRPKAARKKTYLLYCPYCGELIVSDKRVDLRTLSKERKKRAKDLIY